MRRIWFFGRADNVTESENECKLILVYLHEYGSITAKEAFRLCGCKTLSIQIRRIRKMGVPIRTEIHNCKNLSGNPVRYAIYRLEA